MRVIGGGGVEGVLTGGGGLGGAGRRGWGGIGPILAAGGGEIGKKSTGSKRLKLPVFVN